VVDDLFGELTGVIEQVTPRYQRAFQIATQRLGEAGFLHCRPVTSQADAGILAVALAARHTEHPPNSCPPEVLTAGTDIKALASVVRRAKWLKVDQLSTYR
jgi:hypothetical protein